MSDHIFFDSGDERPARRPTLFIVSLCLIALPICAPASADVLLESDFTSTSWYRDWQNVTTKATLTDEFKNTNRISASTTTAGFEPLDGPALQITIPKGENIGTGLSFYPRTVLGKDPSELYLRYDIRFGSDWAPAQNGKLPGFGGTYDVGGWGGKPSNGSNGWSARGKFGEPCANGKVNLGSYVYHADMGSKYGENFKWTKGCDDGLERNRWYSIEYYVKVNTPGSSDGILRGWIDGRLAMERTGLRFDVTGQFQVERVWMNVFHGGGIVAPQEMHLFFDNVVVSQEPIGSGPVADKNAAPKSPSQLSVD